MTRFRVRWAIPAMLTAVSIAGSAIAPLHGYVLAQSSKIYTPISLTPGRDISDRLTEADIPTGQGNFARDYAVSLQAGDQIAIDLSSDNFDTIVTLMTIQGATVAENDDGPDGTTNSLLFTRINRAGNYIVRVKAFGETAGGAFKLKLTRLKPTQ